VRPINISSVYVIICLYIISCLHTDLDCCVDSFTTEQFVPELISGEFQTRLRPLWNRFKGPRRKHKQLTTVINKSISTQIRQAKSVYIYRLYIYRQVYTYRLSLTFSAMSIYIEYIWEKTRTRDTRLYSMQIRQAKSVYIHLDYIYLSVEYASRNIYTSFRAVDFVLMQDTSRVSIYIL